MLPSARLWCCLEPFKEPLSELPNGAMELEHTEPVLTRNRFSIPIPTPTRVFLNSRICISAWVMWNGIFVWPVCKWKEVWKEVRILSSWCERETIVISVLWRAKCVFVVPFLCRGEDVAASEHHWTAFRLVVGSPLQSKIKPFVPIYQLSALIFF